MILCDIVRIHIEESLNWRVGIDPLMLDAIARLGANNYIRINPDSLYQIQKPKDSNVIGFDKLPNHILKSKILSGNDLAKLANTTTIPSKLDFEQFQEIDYDSKVTGDVESFLQNVDYHAAWGGVKDKNKISEILRHRIAKLALEKEDVLFAWKVLMFYE